MFTSGTLSFDSTNLSVAITVNITFDSVVEIDEIFGVLLESNTTRVSLIPSSATVTILNDDSECHFNFVMHLK